MRSILAKLGNIDYRWFFATSLILTAIPLWYPLGLPVLVSEPVAAYYTVLTDLPEGSVVAVSFAASAALLDEQEAQFLATWKILFENNLRVIFYCPSEDGPMILERHLKTVVVPETYGYTYGEDYVVLGFAPLGEPGQTTISTNIRGIYSTDRYGTPLDQLPLMREVNDASGIDLILFQYTSCTDIEWVIRQWVVPHRTPALATTLGCCGPMAAPYYPAQVSGFLSGSGAGTELEVISRHPGPGAAMSDAKNLGIMPLLVALIAGNVAYLAKKYMKEDEE